MFVDNLDCQMGYIRSDEAGEFLAYLVDIALILQKQRHWDISFLC